MLMPIQTTCEHVSPTRQSMKVHYPGEFYATRKRAAYICAEAHSTESKEQELTRMKEVSPWLMIQLPILCD